MRSAWKGNEPPPAAGGLRLTLPECCPQCHKVPFMWKAFGVCTECHFVAGHSDMVPDLSPAPLERLHETAATPMPRMGIGLAKAGSMVKSLSTSAKSSTSSIAGSVPKLGSAGSSFAEQLIQQVVQGRSPVDVLKFLEDEHDIEAASSMVSPKGSEVTSDLIKPGMHIGIRGPVHNGYHTIDTVANGMVMMKGQDGRMETIPLSSLKDHEVVHALENV